MLRRWTVLLGIGLLLCAQEIEASQVVRRFVLAVGANDGGAKREALQYAVSDAQNFVQVMETMGGVDAGVLLSDPRIDHLEEALRVLHNRVASAEAARREVIIYYSGHADENGLRLGESLFSYARLRNAMDQMEAEVHIAILDACASGAITRLKGGRRQKAFMVDASSDMRGYAFLTSSSADEAAQESDAIGASFFSHYLVSGLRGAAAHMGRKDIAEFLLNKGARIDLFAAAMLGKLEIVQAVVNDNPAVVNEKGPHGIALMIHAKKGGKEAAEVVKFLQSVGNSVKKMNC